MRKLILLGVAVIGIVLALASTARAGIDEFPNPKYKGHLLDWCVTWGANCGKPAADKWCQMKGYEGAEAFNKWENAGQSTRLIGSNQVCDEEMCDAFSMVACFKAEAADNEEETFNKPKYKGKRLDWCLAWSKQCGKPAADAYCEFKGYNTSTGFAIANDVGNTRLIGTNEVCTEPFCDGFKFVTCK